MNSSPSPADSAGASEALAEAPPQLVARLAGRAPDAGQPSRAVLTAALLRIQSQNQQQNHFPFPAPMPAPRRRPRLSFPAWSGWAAAAGLAVIFTWEHADQFGHRMRNDSGGLSKNAAVIDVPDGHGPASGGPGVNGSAGPNEDGLPAFDSSTPGRNHRTGSYSQAIKHRATPLTAVQNMDQLRRDLAKLRASNQARFQPSPGLSRTVVVEMTDPSDPREAARISTLGLSERVAESIAAGVSSTDKDPASAGMDPAAAGTLASNEKSDGSLPSPQTPEKKPSEQDLVLSGGDGSWSGDIVIEKGLPNTGLFNLPEGTQIKHLDFPVDDAASYRGLQDLGSGWFYDQFSDLLWQPTGQGKTYIGQKAPAGFDRETFTPPPTASPQLVENPTVPATASTPPADSIPAGVPLEGSTASTGTGASEGKINPQMETAVNTPPVRGYPIFDETTGSGSIILQNLPTLNDFGSFNVPTSLNSVPASDRSSSIPNSVNSTGTGQSYQLWVTDPAADQPISVGLIPTLDGGNGRVWFDLGSPGVAPSGYILTVEPATGSTVPTGRVVLQGP